MTISTSQIVSSTIFNQDWLVQKPKCLLIWLKVGLNYRKLLLLLLWSCGNERKNFPFFHVRSKHRFFIQFRSSSYKMTINISNRIFCITRFYDIKVFPFLFMRGKMYTFVKILLSTQVISRNNLSKSIFVANFFNIKFFPLLWSLYKK